MVPTLVLERGAFKIGLGGVLGSSLTQFGLHFGPGRSWAAPGTLLSALGSPGVDLGPFRGRFATILGSILVDSFLLCSAAEREHLSGSAALAVRPLQ